jgi:hypothetical protein
MQFGKALQRLLHHIHRANPRYGPVYLCKIDISDGFYRVWLRAEDVPKLGVLFPARPGEDQLIAFPLTLPMGWRESPPYFSTATETVADLANASIRNRTPMAPHRLDLIAETPIPTEATPSAHDNSLMAPTPTTPSDRRQTFHKHPTAYWDVYVDDFLGAVQGSKRRRVNTKRHLLHALDSVLRPLSANDTPHRQEPASGKKMAKGDATWSTQKVILGWLVDTTAMTLQLPPHRILRLRDILESVPPTRKRMATKAWHRILGELRSMVAAIPGARGLFSTMQEALRHEKDNRVRLRGPVHDFLHDFRVLAQDLAGRPSRIAELIPGDPVVYGAVDAASPGMGGVLFLPPTNWPTTTKPPTTMARAMA